MGAAFVFCAFVKVTYISSSLEVQSTLRTERVLQLPNSSYVVCDVSSRLGVSVFWMSLGPVWALFFVTISCFLEVTNVHWDKLLVTKITGFTNLSKRWDILQIIQLEGATAITWERDVETLISLGKCTGLRLPTKKVILDSWSLRTVWVTSSVLYKLQSAEIAWTRPVIFVLMTELAAL